MLIGLGSRKSTAYFSQSCFSETTWLSAIGHDLMSPFRSWRTATWITSGWATIGCLAWACRSTAATSWSHWWTPACWTTWPRRSWEGNSKWWTASTGKGQWGSSIRLLVLRGVEFQINSVWYYVQIVEPSWWHSQLDLISRHEIKECPIISLHVPWCSFRSHLVPSMSIIIPYQDPLFAILTDSVS